MESPGKKIELPMAFERADIDHLVVLIADMLDRLIEHNDKIPLSPEALTRFHSRSPPTISVLDYLRRIVKYANVERTCLLITLHYIDQMCTRLPHFTLSSLTCHRFIITAVVVASKALCDSFCTNAHYAKVGGIRVGELNVLEKELLSSLDWRLTSTREVLEAYYVNLIRTHSTGAYTLATESTSPALTDADSDMDSLLSASPSPSGPSAILEDDKPSPLQAQPTRSSVDLTTQQQQIQIQNQATGTGTTIEPTAVLINRATLSPKPSTGPTLEQNMAFAALRRASEVETSAGAGMSRMVGSSVSMSMSMPVPMSMPMDTTGTTGTTAMSIGSGPSSRDTSSDYQAMEKNGGSSHRPQLQITVDHPPPSVLSTSSSILPSSSSSSSSSSTYQSHHYSTTNTNTNTKNPSPTPNGFIHNSQSNNANTNANANTNNITTNTNDIIIIRSPQKRRTTEYIGDDDGNIKGDFYSIGAGEVGAVRGVGTSVDEVSINDGSGDGDGVGDGVDMDSVRPRTRLRIEL